MRYEIRAVHHDGAESVCETDERYISAFEGMHGDSWVLSVDRESHKGTLMSNDIEEPENISPESPCGNLLLDYGEMLWLQACWMSILKVEAKAVQDMFEKAAVRNMRVATSASGELH